MTKKPNLIVLGAQGSGKTTQAELLAKKFNYNLLSTGQVIKSIINRGGPLAKELNKYVSAGKLVPIKMLIKKIWLPQIKNMDAAKGFIFEGTPRNTTQAKDIEKLFKRYHIAEPRLIYLDIKKPTTLKRISSRKICPKCGVNYKPDDKAYKQGLCLKCKTKLIERTDDKKQKTIARRLAIFYKNTKKVIESYKAQKRLIKINGEQPIAKVHQDIIYAIKKIK